MTGLFCRILSLLQGSFAKETYNFKEPTNRSHPICILMCPVLCHWVATISRLLEIIGLSCKIAL